jgi:ribA/ribD-fused uncharacterized protein
MDERVTEKFVFFWNGRFSQWYESPFTIGTMTYNCAEQWMMYQKACVFGDLETAVAVLSTSNPKEQKALGRKTKGFHLGVWNLLCLDIVRVGNLAKFQQNRELGDYLLETGDRVLVEASPYDKIWGIGMGMTDAGVEDPTKWKGLNFLGHVLNNVRDDIQKNRAAEEKEEEKTE